MKKVFVEKPLVLAGSVNNQFINTFLPDLYNNFSKPVAEAKLASIATQAMLARVGTDWLSSF